MVGGADITFAKSFTNDPTVAGGTVTLEFTITNEATSAADVTNMAFTDNLNGVITGLASTSGTQNNICGTGSSISGTTNLSFTGGTLSPGETCTFSVNLSVPAGALPGNFINTTSDLTGTSSGVGFTETGASDTLAVGGLNFTKEFIDDPLVPGGTGTLRFRIENTSALNATNMSFTDSLTAALTGLSAVAPLPANPCGAGSTISGTTTLSFSGGNLLAGNNCQFDVTIQVPGGAAPGDYGNTTSGLLATLGSVFVLPPANDSLTIQSPASNLVLSKSFTDDPVAPGGSPTLEFTINNGGAQAATAVGFTDDLNAMLAGTIFNSILFNDCGGTPTGTGTSLITFSGGAVAAGVTCTLRVSLTIPGGSAPGLYLNTTSSLSATVGGLTGTTGNASDSLNVVSSTATFAKSFTDDPVGAGSTVTLEFTINNTGTGTLGNLAFNDDLNAVITGLVATGLPQANICGAGSNISGTSLLTFTGGNLTAGTSCTFSVTLQVPAAATAGTFPNTTSNLTDNGIFVIGPASDSLTIEPPPTFAKVFAPDTIFAGANSTLLFTIDNSASAIAASALDFTDNLPAGVTVAAPAGIATNCTGGTITAVSGTGVISYTGGTVAAGATCSVQANVTSTSIGAHVNTTGDLTSSSGNSGTATDTLTVNAQADVSVTKTDGVTTAVPGNNVTYTIVASNAGPSDDPSVNLADTFPSGLTCSFTSTAAGGATGNTAAGAGNLVENLSLRAGSSVTYTVTCAIPSNATGTLSNTATVTPSINDPVAGNNSATDNDTVLTPQADLSVTKNDGVSAATPGTNVTYTIVAANAGPSAEPAATLTDTFPPELTCTFTSVAAGGATGNTAAGAGNLAETLALPAGSSVTYTAVCAIDAAATGTLTNTATISGTATDPVPGNNTATDSNTMLNSSADLSVTLTDSPDPVNVNGNLDYTATISNAGPSQAMNVVSTMTLPTGVTFVSSTGCTEDPNGVPTCSLGNIASGANVAYTVTVSVNPGTVGLIDNNVSVTSGTPDPNLANNAATEQTNVFAPDIRVTGNAVEIADGDTTPDIADHTDFGLAPLTTGMVSRTFTIQNVGTDVLTLGANAASSGGANASDFTVTTQPAVTVAVGASTTVVVEFDPSAVGLRTATLTIANNDPDESPYDFSIQGTGSGSPEIRVTGNSVQILDGDTTPDTADHTDFGSSDITAGTVSRTFTVQNIGTATLNLGATAATLSGANAGDFSVTTQPATTVAIGASTDVVVEFDPSALGLRTATLSIANDDPDENPFDFTIQGTGTGIPEIRVTGNAVEIADGDTTPSVTDDTDFGAANITTDTVSRTFTIENNGTDVLQLGPNAATLGGANSGEFSVTTQPANTVPVGGTTTVVVQFDPSGLGVRSATVSIANDDPDESPYDFAIQGTGETNGQVTFVQNVIGPDITVNYSSTTPAFNFALTTSGGTAQTNIESVAAGTYAVTAADLTGAGYGLVSIACDDGNSTGDLPSRTATIILEAEEHVTCTFSTVESREHTSRMIADYLGARNTLLLSHQPDRDRRVTKLKEVNGNNDVGDVSAFGFSANTPLLLNAEISENALSFNTSLSKIARSGEGPSGLASAYAANSRWDVWIEGHIARFDDDSSQGGSFGVVYGGVEYLINPDALVGVMVQYDWMDQSYGPGLIPGSGDAEVTGHGWMVGPYATLRLDEHFYFDIRGAWGRSDNSIKPFGTYEDDFETERWLASAALVGQFEIGEWEIKPAISFQYIEENQFGYTDSLGVRIPSQTVSQGDVRLGPRIGYTHNLDNGTTINPWIEFNGVYTFSQEGEFTSGSLASETQGLTGQVKAGLNINAANGTSLTISGQYDGIGTSTESYGGSLKLVVPLN